MLPQDRTPTHPGEILQQDFLDPLGITQTALAHHLDIPIQRINELIRAKRGVTPETAWLLAGALGTTPELWLNLQANHDLARTRLDQRNVDQARPATRRRSHPASRAAS